MVYMLFDNPADKKNMDFLKDYETCSIKQIYPEHKCNSTKEMIKVCRDCLKQSQNGDIIICWYDFMAVLLWWICKFQRKYRKIIVLNILLKDKNTVKNRIAKFLYKPVLKSKQVKATVTSPNYGKYLNQVLKIQKKYILLHDIYHENYKIECDKKEIDNSVFCGGRNGRDWDFLLKVAKEMPDVTFNCVMPKDKYEQYKQALSKNINVEFDITEQEFLEVMYQSKLIVTPLETEAPAGLIVFFQAGANRKMIITSDTVTTQEYFAEERGVLCGKSIEMWKKKIYYYLRHEEEAEKCARKFEQFLNDNCSEENYAKIISSMI